MCIHSDVEVPLRFERVHQVVVGCALLDVIANLVILGLNALINVPFVEVVGRVLALSKSSDRSSGIESALLLSFPSLVALKVKHTQATHSISLLKDYMTQGD